MKRLRGCGHLGDESRNIFARFGGGRDPVGFFGGSGILERVHRFSATGGQLYRLQVEVAAVPGTVAQSIPITVLADPQLTATTSFKVRLSNPNGAVLGSDTATLSLRGEPAQVTFSKTDAGGVSLRVHMIAGRNYELQRSTSPGSGDWSFVAESSVSTGEGDADLSDPLSEDAPIMFYRIVVTTR